MDGLHVLLLTAVSLGFVHTLLGPDHYLAFIVLSKARKWSKAKTLWITFIGGVGHVGGSVVIGIVGVALGLSLSKLNSIEDFRGNVVGWMIIVFGIGYIIYGICKFIKNGHHHHLPKFLMPKSIRPYRHLPTTEKEEQETDTTNITPWILFLIFVFGPCEVLIPLIMIPASKHDTLGVVLVALIFGIATIATMLATVYAGYMGTSLIRFKKGEKYLHLFAGFIILLLGLGIQFLGW
jgi:sulfite exporter TauE/SafE